MARALRSSDRSTVVFATCEHRVDDVTSGRQRACAVSKRETRRRPAGFVGRSVDTPAATSPRGKVRAGFGQKSVHSSWAAAGCGARAAPPRPTVRMALTGALSCRRATRAAGAAIRAAVF